MIRRISFERTRDATSLGHRHAHRIRRNDRQEETNGAGGIAPRMGL